jgi:hypothetical protein
VAPIATSLDVGAPIGAICIPAVKRGLAGRSIAVQAVPVIALLLQANVALNEKVGRR